jgi:hypothetical protein
MTMIRLCGFLLIGVGSVAVWISTREPNAIVALLGGIDVSSGLLILISSWPRKIEHQSDVTASHIFRK